MDTEEVQRSEHEPQSSQPFSQYNIDTNKANHTLGLYSPCTQKSAHYNATRVEAQTIKTLPSESHSTQSSQISYARDGARICTAANTALLSILSLDQCSPVRLVPAIVDRSSLSYTHLNAPVLV